MTDTALVTTAMPQAMHLESKRHHTPKANSKVCESEKDIGVTAVAGQGVKSKAGIAGHLYYNGNHDNFYECK